MKHLFMASVSSWWPLSYILSFFTSFINEIKLCIIPQEGGRSRLRAAEQATWPAMRVSNPRTPRSNAKTLST